MTRPRMVYRPPRARQRLLLPGGGSAEGVCVAVEEPIGVGKTTLARLLAESLEATTVLEVVEENPFLHHFYRDIRAYAFQTQMFFFLSRYRALVIYLTAQLETLTDRIAHRDRPFERAIEPAYLERLRGEYEGFFDAYDETALLTLNTDEVDIFTEADLKEIVRYVDEAAAS